MINKYGRALDTILNIFLMPHHPDSVGSPTYNAVGTGIMLGNSIKVCQIFSRKPAEESCTGLLNHEIGHALGLSHAWGANDGCDDTPQNPNCWYYTNDGSACDSLVSNNMMDYNAWQMAITPCQMGRVLRTVTSIGSRIRKFMRPDWCNLNDSQSIVIADTVRWLAARDFGGNITIASGGFLEIGCRLSMPANASITVAPGGHLFLNDCQVHNSCDDKWNGIVIQHQGKLSGKVEAYGTPRIENTVHAVDLNGDQ